MTPLIQRTLARRLAASSELAGGLADLRSLLACEAVFLGPLGEPYGPHPCRFSGLCGEVQKGRKGLSLCQRTSQKLLQEARERPAAVTCDAGLREVAVPIQSGPHPVGFLLTGGHRLHQAEPVDVKRSEHLLGRAGIALARDSIRPLLQECRGLSGEQEEALTRLLRLLADHLGRCLLQLAARADRAVPATSIPGPVRRVLVMLRSRFHEPVTLEMAAEQAGLSQGHLSRLFHDTMGICFSDYLNELRLSKARELLARGHGSVAEISWESGFQSISQFNRRFKAAQGESPRQFRNRKATH